MSTTILSRLQPGTRFRVPELGIDGLLLYANECRARVRIDQPPREVEISARDGRKRRFVARRRHGTDWAPSVPVVPTGTQPVPPTTTREKETTMPAKKTAKTRASHGNAVPRPGSKKATKTASTKKKKKTAPKKAAKTAPAKTGKRKLSALDAAAKVIAETGGPMSAKQLIEAMAQRKLWTSPGGKTPEATLSAAITREIAKKGTESRFRKQDRGRFVANT